MPETKFSFGFTAGALLYRDSVLLSKLYLETKNWDKVREMVLSDNLLQIKTVSAQKRIYSETFTRLKTLSEPAIELIANGNRDEQCQLLWYALCKKYDFIRDFALEVFSDKINRRDYIISIADFNIFFSRKAELVEKLNNISVISRKKLQTNLFKMMQSAGIVDSDQHLKLLMISPQVKQIITADGTIPLTIYPLIMGF